jgi:agmatine deiminase
MKPAELGYRLPAEWEPHAATWLAWPCRPATWLGDFAAIPAAYARVARQIAAFEPVRIIGTGDVLGDARRHLGEVADITFVDIPTNDSWVRDTGPVFVRRQVAKAAPDACRLAAVTWDWNAWGGKYPPWDDDARVAAAIAAHLGLHAFAPGIVLEGGAIETDGAGTLLANERCVVDPKRNPGRGKPEMEQALRENLGVGKVLWVGGELAGDDTDGHIDQLARFVAPGRVVAARQPDRLDPNHAALEENLELLATLRDAAGRRLEVIPIDIPPRFSFQGVQLPASHLNFYVGNGFVGVPVFGAATDAAALGTLERCFPGRRAVPIDCREIVRGRGGLHCITRDEPSVASFR